MAGREYDFWLFDLDGTVVDIEPDYVHEVIGEVGDRLGREFSDREAELLWYGIGDGRDRLLADFGVDPERFWVEFHEVEDPIARAEATYLYDDAAAMVPERSEPLGVVTHCQEYLAEPVMDNLDIGDWFDTVVCCTEETGWKPDPAPVEMAMRDLGVAYNGHEGVLVGDDPSDVGAAWNAGLEAVHVERHDPDRVGLSVLGDHRLTSLTEFET